MKGITNKFMIKNGISPEYIGSPLYINTGRSCILVFDNNICVGVVWKHYENRKSDANGQAEIRFFERYRNAYGLWHRMFVNGQRLSYIQLQSELSGNNEYIYWGDIRNNKNSF